MKTLCLQKLEQKTKDKLLQQRYSRQELLLGKAQQNLLQSKTVAIIGVGGLGSPAAEMLARIGVSLLLIDKDKIEKSNLPRQFLFEEKDVGKSKALTAKNKLEKINSNLKIKAYNIELNQQNLNLIKNADLILDCTDNLETRFLINKFCHQHKIPWIYASAIRNEGYVMPILPHGPCLNCFLKAGNKETCQSAGVINTITTSIAALQVNLAVKILTKQKVEPTLYYLNLNNIELKKLKVNKNKNCVVCKN
jgi:adenylyltransferase/sulfurtransferase